MSENENQEKYLNSLSCIDHSRDSVLHKMYVSNVGNRLREMETPSDIDCQRWPWELMQNAKDSISCSDRNSVEIILEIYEDKVIFQHDGCPFNGKTYLALLYKYSEGKSNNTESTGRFGTGFLTTHSLSKVVQMEGPIIDEDGTICEFFVTMYRDGKNNEELIEGMKKMEDEKKFWRNRNPKWTKFNYILKTKRNKESSILGAMNFQNNIILTMLFNQKINRVTLKYKEINLIYEKIKEKQEIEKNNIEIISYTLHDIQTNEKKTKSYLHSKISEYSKELSLHYNKERNLLVECALEIEPKQKNILYDEKSPCLFCSLPLVGSENHILPIILNSNDFEPSTERQEILLDGSEIKKDEKNNIEIPTDVGINRYILRRAYILFENIIKYCSENKFNNLHLLARGLKLVPKVNRYFDKKWYEEHYMNDMRNILLKYPIIYNTNNELEYIKNIYFPIYDLYNDDNYMKTFYYLIKELFVNVPRYEESIEWSKYLWEKNLEKNRIDIYSLIKKYNESKHDFDYNNCFIKFIWNYYKKLTLDNKILINQENNYVIYNEKEFSQSNNVSEDMINLIEELGNKWRINHLNKKIISIELPIKHDIDYSISLIKKTIENDKEKSYILTRYVEKNNIKRENIYYLSKLIFKSKIKEKYLVEKFPEEIWNISDKYIIDKMISIAERWRSIKEMEINIDDYNKILNYLYKYNNNIFDEIKLLPSINGEFNLLKDLKEEKDINEAIKNGAKLYINLKFDDKILNPKIKIENLIISKYTMDNLLNEINQFLNNPLALEGNKIELCKILINFIPKLESNDANDNILIKHNDIRLIYSFVSNKTLKNELIHTKENSIWASIDKYIMIYVQKSLQDSKQLSLNLNKNMYIKILNEYQKYFNFEEYSIIPNAYGLFSNIKNLKDYNDIPFEILNGIKKIFFKDFFSISVLQGIKINRINKISIKDLGDIIQKCFDDKKKEFYSFDYKYTFEICKILIKYIPSNNNRLKEKQIKLYNLYKIFDKKIEESIEIDSNENLYNEINEGIIQFINQKISECKTVEGTKIYTDDIFKLINENYEFLLPNKYKILPNQLGELKMLDSLYRDNDIYEDLKDILSNYSDIREKLIDNRIKQFPTNKIISNEDLIKEIDNLITTNNKFDIRKTLSLIPKEDSKEKEKQKNLIYIYENLLNNKEKLLMKEIDLKPTFWIKTNELCLNKFKEFFNIDKNKHKSIYKPKSLELKNIDEIEENALNILVTLYKYIPPELQDNKNIKFVPNQYGNLLSYSQLSEEKDLNQDFKNMLKKYFDYDISYYLKHKNLKYTIDKELTINEEIINIINKGFNISNENNLKIISKEFIKFYPKIKEEDNYVLRFIDCYKSLTGEKFNEQEINTNNMNIWDKAIKILLVNILNIINSDKELKKTSERTKLDENTTIKKLNIFYSILFKMNIFNEKSKLSFIPNEMGIYKQLKDVYNNYDIDNEIKDVLSLLNEKKSYDHILIHHKIKLEFQHNQKKLEDIALVIDKEIKYIYNEINQKNIEDENNIDENIKKSCKLLIQKWFKEHKDKIKLFDFINKNLADICIKILFDVETKKLIDELLINDYQTFIDIIKFQGDPNAPFLYEDSISEIEEESSFDATRDNSINVGNNLNFFINNNNNNNLNINNNNININNNNNNIIHIPNNYHNNYIHYYPRLRRVYNRVRNNNNNYVDWARIRYEEGIKKYCLAQALVYEKLLDSHLFNVIEWINKVNEDQEGELIILSNGHRYKVKKNVVDFEFKVKTNQNKEYKIKVKRGENSNNAYLKFKYNNTEWNLFKNESLDNIFAFINIKNENNPEIIFSKSLKLDEL